MIFWLIAGAMLLAAVLAVLAPLIRRRVEISDRAEHGLQVFRDQLAEIESDRAAGRLQEDQAASARLEIERRLLQESERVQSGAESTENQTTVRWQRLAAAFLIILAMPVATLIVYLGQGTPGMPDIPLADRAAERARMAEVEERRRGLEEMAEQLSERLEGEPTDLDGWMLLGRTRLMLDQPQEAAAAFRAATGLPGAGGEIWSTYGEALSQNNDGLVTVESALSLS